MLPFSSFTFNKKYGLKKVIPSFRPLGATAQGELWPLSTLPPFFSILHQLKKDIDLHNYRLCVIICVKHLWWCVLLCVGNPMEEKTRVFNETLCMVISAGETRI
jgi:hypothetical protein